VSTVKFGRSCVAMGRSSVAGAVLVSTRKFGRFVSRSSVAMGRSSVARAVLVSTRNFDVFVSRSSVAMGRSSVAGAVLVSTRNFDVFVSRSSVAMGRSSVAGAVLVSTRNLDVLVSRSSVGFEKFLWYSVPMSLSHFSSASTSGYFWPFWLFSIRLAMWPWPGHLREFVIFFENIQNYLKNQKKTFRIY
jgi:hypothetical protein